MIEYVKNGEQFQYFDINKKNIAVKSYYMNNKKNGPYELYFNNGKLWIKGVFLNDNRIGLWIQYSYNYDFLNKTYYIL